MKNPKLEERFQQTKYQIVIKSKEPQVQAHGHSAIIQQSSEKSMPNSQSNNKLFEGNNKFQFDDFNRLNNQFSNRKVTKYTKSFETSENENFQPELIELFQQAPQVQNTQKQASKSTKELYQPQFFDFTSIQQEQPIPKQSPFQAAYPNLNLALPDQHCYEQDFTDTMRARPSLPTLDIVLSEQGLNNTIYIQDETRLAQSTFNYSCSPIKRGDIDRIMYQKSNVNTITTGEKDYDPFAGFY